MSDVFNCVIRLGKAIFGDLILSRPNLRYENAYSAKVSSIDIEKRAKAVIEEAKEIQKNAIDVLYNI